MASKDGRIIGTAQLVKAVLRASQRLSIHEQTNAKRICSYLQLSSEKIHASDMEIQSALDWLMKQKMISIT